MIGKILLAVDGSQHSLSATDMAAELADKLNAELFIVHVLMHGRPPAELLRMAEVEHLVEKAHAVAFPSVPYVPENRHAMMLGSSDEAGTARAITALGEQIVDRAKVRCLELGVRKVTTMTEMGDYADEILEAARTRSVDMIVIGSRGLGAIKSTVLGSVSQKVLHHAQCAVLTVR
ncbi:Nucleotide-binding universal stress protein, UspA family [Roseovarius marisflavi]|uniref:Nucleotide-binding universal stress protein, UspA family n=1 Tax=Roseovarius marisflavi TaxID=1054996 RepID=A0A1M7BQR2_9RHOB|nr:universal stress protein [Roseovarius marisflavi]SHL57378.1 Nucleotide-binding universal stress protein, UspA family [Roseovarius marisflavi]